VTPFGKGDQVTVPSKDLVGEFYAHKGAGYDPSKVANPLAMQPSGFSPETAVPDDPMNGMQDASAGGFVPAHSADLTAKYFMVGSGFTDEDGKVWMVKQSGATMIISNGLQNYTLDGDTPVWEPTEESGEIDT